MAGFLERPTPQVSNTSIDRCGLRVSASPLEFHSQECERLNLMPFGQSIPGCPVTLGRETVEKFDGRVVTPFLCCLECFSHSVSEPDVIQSHVRRRSPFWRIPH
jgi:hypothetical protein